MSSRLDEKREKILPFGHRRAISQSMIGNRNSATARSYGGDQYEIVNGDEWFPEPLDIEKEYYKMQIEDEIKKQAGWRGRLRLWLRSFGQEYGQLYPERGKYFEQRTDDRPVSER